MYNSADVPRVRVKVKVIGLWLGLGLGRHQKDVYFTRTRVRVRVEFVTLIYTFTRIAAHLDVVLVAVTLFKKA